MSENAGQFKKALFGGFRRQDVLKYIETLTQNQWEERQNETRMLHRQMEEERRELETGFGEQLAQRDEELRKLREMVEKLQAEQESSAEALTQKDNELRRLRQQMEKTRSEQGSALAETTRALAQRENELQGLRSKMAAEAKEKEAAEGERFREIKELCRRVQELTPQAEAWQKIQHRVGEITVSAHVQAQNTIQRANEQANKARSEGEHWAQEMQGWYTSLEQTFLQSVSQAEEELDAAKESFRRARADLKKIQSALDDLKEETEVPSQGAEDRDPLADMPEEAVWDPEALAAMGTMETMEEDGLTPAETGSAAQEESQSAETGSAEQEESQPTETEPAEADGAQPENGPAFL